jgi:primosomal protein N' (replication factor Y) (superfamily II helicase)
MERKAGRYQAHMVLLSKDRARMHFYIRQWWQNVWHNKPHGMKLSLDIDPQELS